MSEMSQIVAPHMSPRRFLHLIVRLNTIIIFAASVSGLLMRGPMMAGFLCLFPGLLCDTVSNDDQFFHWLTSDLQMAKKLHDWFAAFEGALTLLPEGLIIAAFYAAWKTARPPSLVVPIKA